MQLKVTEALEQGFEQGVSDMQKRMNEHLAAERAAMRENVTADVKQGLLPYAKRLYIIVLVADTWFVVCAYA